MIAERPDTISVYPRANCTRALYYNTETGVMTVESAYVDYVDPLTDSARTCIIPACLKALSLFGGLGVAVAGGINAGIAGGVSAGVAYGAGAELGLELGAKTGWLAHLQPIPKFIANLGFQTTVGFISGGVTAELGWRQFFAGDGAGGLDGGLWVYF